MNTLHYHILSFYARTHSVQSTKSHNDDTKIKTSPPNKHLKALLHVTGNPILLLFEVRTDSLHSTKTHNDDTKIKSSPQTKI
jgi:hypothetical protein